LDRAKQKNSKSCSGDWHSSHANPNLRSGLAQYCASHNKQALERLRKSEGLELGLYLLSKWRTQEFCSGGRVQQIQLRTEGRENGDLGAVALYSGISLNLQICETHIVGRLLQMFFFSTELGIRLSFVKT
jgi:hypothetical protein